MKTFLLFFFISICFQSNAQVNPVFIFGKDYNDYYRNFFFTDDQGFLFGSNEYISKYNSTLDSVWSKTYGNVSNIIYSDFSLLKDNRIAMCGSYGTNGIVLIMDSLANPVDSINYLCDEWSFRGISIYSQSDSGFVFTGYYDGISCDNSFNIYRYNKNLVQQWSVYEGVCQGYITVANGFNDLGKMFYIYHGDIDYEPYMDAGWFDQSGVMHGDSIQLYRSLSLVEGTSDSGAIACGYLDTLNSYDLLLVKLDKNNHVQWVNSFGSIYNDLPVSIVQTPEGGFAILTEQTDPNNAGDDNIRLFKADSIGNKLWEKEFGTARNDYPQRLKVTPTGGYAILANTDGFNNKRNLFILTDSMGEINAPYSIQSLSHYYCAGQTSILTITPPAVSYLWNTGDTTQNISVNSTGDFYATVTDSSGNIFQVPFFDVRFNTVPDSVIHPDSIIQICYGKDTTMSINFDVGSQYRWFYNGNVIPDINFNVITVDSAGLYHCEVNNACGLFTTHDAQLIVNPTPGPLAISASPSLHNCFGTPVVLSVVPDSNDAPRWSYYNNTYYTDSMVFTAVKGYSVSVAQINSFNCISSSSYVYMTIDSSYKINIIPDSASICLPLRNTIITTNLTVNNGSVYLYQNNILYDSLISRIFSNYEFPVDTPGIYKMVFINACRMDSDSVIVKEFHSPQIIFFPPSPKLCSNKPFIVTCVTPGQYSWYPGGSTSGQIEISSTGSYTLNLTDSVSGCMTDKYFIVSNDTNSSIKVYAGPDSVLCPGRSDLLSIGNNYIASYWSDGTFGNSIQVTNPGIEDSVYYYVTALDIGNCPSSDTVLIVNNLCSGISSIDGAVPMRIYPNPATNYFTIRFMEDRKREIFMYNAIGELILKSTCYTKMESIDVSVFPAGVYDLRVSDDDSEISGRIIIQR